MYAILTLHNRNTIALINRFVFESASWLVTRGETERAVAVLKKIAAINGREVPEIVYQNFKV